MKMKFVNYRGFYQSIKYYMSFLNNLYLYLICLKQQGFSANFNENEFEVNPKEQLVKDALFYDAVVK